MNQTSHLDKETRRAPPQLFGPSPAKRHPDFEESILATIDGGSQSASAGSGTRLKAFVILSGVALAGVAVYLAVQEWGASTSPNADLDASGTRVRMSATQREAAPFGPVSSAPVALIDKTSSPQATASIETVTQPGSKVSPSAVASAGDERLASVSAPVSTVLPSDKTVAASAISTSARPSASSTSASRPTAGEAKHGRQRGYTGAKVAKASTSASTGKRKSQRDADAELLAAMLPYLSAAPVPTSPGLEKRCGLSDAGHATACRMKYCNGREGVDVACPVESSGNRPAQ
jgi:hypothetical protein